MITTIPRVDVLGVGISALTMPVALDEISRWVESRQQHYVCVTGVHGVMESQNDPDLMQIHNESGLTTPDGMPMVWSARWAGARYVERVYGPDLMLALLGRAADRGWSSFFYGGGPGVPDLMVQRLCDRFPGLKVAGTFSPPFHPLDDEEDQAVVDLINRAEPDLVWVGLSTPKQERWMAVHQGQIHASAMLGVGAAFDIHAGLLAQAPPVMQRSGLEWAYRLYREPRRLWRRYLSNNPRFVLALMKRPPRMRSAESLETDSRSANFTVKDGRSRGAFVVVVGPDGVGKTSVARTLTEQFSGPTGYFHFRPPLRGSLASGPPSEPAAPSPKNQFNGPRVLGWLRLAKNVVLCWFGYLRTVRPAVRTGTLVVGDRWSYGYLVQPVSLRYYGPEWLAAFSLRILPRPDLVINLTAPPDEISQRKQELSPAEIAAELGRWATLQAPRIQTFAADHPPGLIAQRVLAELAR